MKLASEMLPHLNVAAAALHFSSISLQSMSLVIG
jgi:hypothetical protein